MKAKLYRLAGDWEPIVDMVNNDPTIRLKDQIIVFEIGGFNWVVTQEPKIDQIIQRSNSFLIPENDGLYNQIREKEPIYGDKSWLTYLD